MKAAIAIVGLLLATPCYAGWLTDGLIDNGGGSSKSGGFEPGGYFNPTVIEKTGEGRYEVHPELPIGHNILKPGGYLNPYVVEEQPNGDVKIRPSLPIN